MRSYKYPCIYKYSEKYFGRKVSEGNYKEKIEFGGGWLECYYEDQKYHFGFNHVDVKPDTSIVIKEISETSEDMITCKVDKVINDGMGIRVDDNFLIDLEKKDNRYIIKNIRQ